MLSGLLLWAAFPALDWAVLGWVALTPLFYLMLTRSLWESTLFGFVAGLVFFAGMLYYIGQFGPIPWLALSAFEALFFAVAAAFGCVVGQRAPQPARPLALAATWLLTMYLRGHVGPLSLPLGDLGYTQHATPAVVQLAAVFGIHGVTFLLAAVNAAWAEGLSSPWPMSPGRWRAVVGIAAVALAVVVLGHVRYARLAGQLPSEGEGVRVAAVQAAEWPPSYIEPGFVRRTVREYRRLSLPVRADLIVWPETAMLADPADYPDVQRRVEDTARRTGAWLLYGNAPLTNAERRNAATLLDPQGHKRAEYSKVHLVIFGEYVPYRERFRFIERFPVRETDFAPGEGFTVMQAGQLRFSPLICFESLFPEYSRKCVKMGAEAIVIITSDAWAGRSAELEQHAACSVFRAVETGRYVVRAATTGITMIVGPNGHIVAEVPAYRPGVAAASVRPITNRTPYVRWGDWPVVMVWVGGVGWAVVGGRALTPGPSPVRTQTSAAAGEGNGRVVCRRAGEGNGRVVCRPAEEGTEG